MLFGFGTTFFLIFRNEREEEVLQKSFCNYFRSISTTFSIMLGDFNFYRFYDSEASGLGTGLVIVYLIIAMIVMLNLLVTIMGASYNHIKNNEEISFYIARAQILQDLEYKLSNASIHYYK